MKRLKKSFKRTSQVLAAIGFGLFITFSPLIAKEPKELEKTEKIEYRGEIYSSKSLLSEGISHAGDKIPTISFEITELLIDNGEDENAFKVLECVYTRINDKKKLIDLDKKILIVYAELGEKLGKKYQKNKIIARGYWCSAKQAYVLLEDWEKAKECSINERKNYK